MSLTVYACIHIWGAALFNCIYFLFIQDTVYIYKPLNSAYLLHMGAGSILLLQLLTLLGFTFTAREDRSWWRALCNLLAPFGLHFTAELNSGLPKVVLFLVILAGLVVVISGAQVLAVPWEGVPLGKKVCVKLRFWLSAALKGVCPCLAGVVVFCMLMAATPAAALENPYSMAQRRSGAVTEVRRVEAIWKGEEWI